MAAFRVSAAMALCFLFSLVVIARSVPLKEAGLTTNASSAAVTAAEVHAAPDGEGLLLLPYSDDSVVPAAAVEAVAEPDPDRSLPSSDVEVEEEEWVNNQLQAARVEQGGEKTEEQIDDDEDDGDEEEQEKLKKKNKDKDKEKEKKKDKQKDKEKEKDKEKKKDKDKEKEKKKHKEKEKKDKDKEKQKQKKKDKDKDKDKRKEKEKEKRKDKDENEQEEEKERWWRKKAISRSMFGHGRRSQREEAAKEEVKN